MEHDHLSSLSPADHPKHLQNNLARTKRSLSNAELTFTNAG